MRVGTGKRSVTDRAVREALSRATEQRYVGGPAFDLADPVQRLIFTIGSGFFGEDKFYDSLQPTDVQGHRTAKASLSTYKGETLVHPENIKDRFGFNESARDLVRTMREIAEEKNFEDLLILARWAREDLNLRQTPIMALVISARAEFELGRGSGLIRKYTPLILRRADEPKRAFAAYRHLFMEGADGRRKGSFPKQFARGLIESLQQFNEYQILKYDSSREAPTFKDLAIFLSRYEGRGKGRPRRSNMRPFSHAMAKYLIDGEINAKALPKVAARAKLFKLKTWCPTAKKLALEGDVTWENLISHFGSTKATWGWLIQNRKLPYMAMLRNLRNLEKVGLSDSDWERVYSYLTSDVNHRQMPFRFLSARKEVSHQTARSAIDIALDKSVQNIPDLGGKTFIMVDASGSMDALVSKRSTISCKEVGMAMAAVLAKRVGRRARLGVFGTRFQLVSFSEANSVMAIVNQLKDAGIQVGHATHAHLGLVWALGKYTGFNAEEFDRVIIVSDMNCYSENFLRNGTDLVSLLAEYRHTVNPDVFFYSLNISGGNQSQMDPKNDRTLLMSGWSEKVFHLIAQFENPGTLPTIDALRDRFSYSTAS